MLALMLLFLDPFWLWCAKLQFHRSPCGSFHIRFRLCKWLSQYSDIVWQRNKARYNTDMQIVECIDIDPPGSTQFRPAELTIFIDLNKTNLHCLLGLWAFRVDHWWLLSDLTKIHYLFRNILLHYVCRQFYFRRNTFELHERFVFV